MERALRSFRSVKVVGGRELNGFESQEQGGLELNVRIDDLIQIVCPYFEEVPEREGPAMTEEDYDDIQNNGYLHVNLVDEIPYLNCALDASRKLMAICDNPRVLTVVTIVVRTFSPVPGAMEFRPGNTYYWISTSDGTVSGLHYQQYGVCKDYNMRMRIIVAEEEASHPIVQPPPTVEEKYRGHPHCLCAGDGKGARQTETVAHSTEVNQNIKMVQGWIDREEGQQRVRVGSQSPKSAWDPQPMHADMVVAYPRESYDFDFIVSELIGQSLSIDGPVQTVTKDESIPPGAEMQEDPMPEVATQDSNLTVIQPAADGMLPPSMIPASGLPPVAPAPFEPAVSAAPNMNMPAEHETEHGSEHGNAITGQPTVTEFKFSSDPGNNSTSAASIASLTASATLAAVFLVNFH